MNYMINYAVHCMRGHVRSQNQDNFWCAGKYLDAENEGLDGGLSGLVESVGCPAFAVFDGMGGEQHGEMAAFLAAQAFDEHSGERTDKPPAEFLGQMCRQMNESICDYATKKRIASMGTTLALVAFFPDAVYVANIGDSKILWYSAATLVQVSHDHVAKTDGPHKPPLTQHLGIPEAEFVIAPHIAKGPYAEGDRYLIASDGLTDMVNEMEIKEILNKHRHTDECVSVLVEKALENGGVDNITVILCDVQRRRRWPHGRRG